MGMGTVGTLWGANIVLLSVLILGGLGFIVMATKASMLDFVKANFGLLVLLLLFLVLLTVGLHVFHDTSPDEKDFLAWLEQKGGEVLAAIMTLIVGVRNTNQRSGDSKTDSTTSTLPPPTPTPSPGAHP